MWKTLKRRAKSTMTLKRGNNIFDVKQHAEFRPTYLKRTFLQNFEDF